jgi:chemotaxis signal transduction protein
MVAFRAGGRDFAVRIEQVRRVLAATGLAPLPDPLPGVAGLLRHDGATLTVLAPLGSEQDGGQVLVLDHGGGATGLLVDEVTGIRQVDEAAIGPPPAGQRVPLVTGVLAAGAELLLLVDAAALVEAARR